MFSTDFENKKILISFIHSVIGTVPLALNLCPNPRRMAKFAGSLIKWAFDRI